MRKFIPTLRGIEFGSAFMASICTLVFFDLLVLAAPGGISPSVSAFFFEMGMLAVATVLAVHMHLRGRSHYTFVILGLVAVAWALAAVIIAPLVSFMIPLALMAFVAVATGVINELHRSRLATADSGRAN